MTDRWAELENKAGPGIADFRELGSSASSVNPIVKLKTVTATALIIKLIILHAPGVFDQCLLPNRNWGLF